MQGTIEGALRQFTGEDIRVRGASRTDSGAHAQGQVVDFLTESRHEVESFIRALNHFLPADVRVLAARAVPPEFHSRRSALSRLYRYQILNRPEPSAVFRTYHHWVRERLDLGLMQEAAQDLVGRHDFRIISGGHPKDRSSVRWVNHWKVERQGEVVVIQCEANGFLRQQIRRANAILVEIGKGRWPKTALKDILAGQCCDNMSWPSLPAKGLCLIRVNYPDSWLQVSTSNETD